MRKVIRRRVRRQGKGVNLVADVNMTVATSEAGEAATSRQEVKIVQRASRAGTGKEGRR